MPSLSEKNLRLLAQVKQDIVMEPFILLNHQKDNLITLSEELDIPEIIRETKTLFTRRNLLTSKTRVRVYPNTARYNLFPNTEIQIYSDDCPVGLDVYFRYMKQNQTNHLYDLDTFTRIMGVRLSYDKPVSDPELVTVTSGDFESKNPWFSCLYIPEDKILITQELRNFLNDPNLVGL